MSRCQLAFILCIMMTALLCGCNRQKEERAAAPAPRATTAPEQPVAISPPAATQPQAPPEAPLETPPAVIVINQMRTAFPSAMVRLRTSDGHVIAMLYSDDPKDALDEKYTGNGFYFEMPLDVTEIPFDEAIWVHRAGSSERVDTPYGIFLNGHRQQLQPLDVRARFTPAAGGMMKVELSGTFLLVNTQEDTSAAQSVSVAAYLLADQKPTKTP